MKRQIPVEFLTVLEQNNGTVAAGLALNGIIVGLTFSGLTAESGKVPYVLFPYLFAIYLNDINSKLPRDKRHFIALYTQLYYATGAAKEKRR
jgi:hypothetical protein